MTDPFAAMFDLPMLSLLAIVVRTAIVYAAVVVGLRLLGKRELGQMTIFDFVLLLTLSNAVQNAMTGGDNSLTGGLVSALTLLLMDRLLAFLGVRNPVFRHFFVGQPDLLIHNGEYLWDHLRKEGIDQDELLQVIREHGMDDVKAVRTAILEVDGTISIVPADAPKIAIHAHRHRLARNVKRET